MYNHVQCTCIHAYTVPPIVIDKQPPSKWRGEYGEEVRLECSAHSPKGKRLAYQWVKDKKGMGTNIHMHVLVFRIQIPAGS